MYTKIKTGLAYCNHITTVQFYCRRITIKGFQHNYISISTISSYASANTYQVIYNFLNPFLGPLNTVFRSLDHNPVTFDPTARKANSYTTKLVRNVLQNLSTTSNKVPVVLRVHMNLSFHHIVLIKIRQSYNWNKLQSLSPTGHTKWMKRDAQERQSIYFLQPSSNFDPFLGPILIPKTKMNLMTQSKSINVLVSIW